ncbi:MAG: shikimate dehydrogenase, partial [Sphingobacteriia bacterium]
MRTFGLLGYPLTHSFSKQYFSDKFQQENIPDAEYLNFSFPDVEEMREKAAELPSLKGFNITIPHKKNILPFLDEQSPAVAAIGACNCVLVKAGKWMGYNTDVEG